MLFIIYAVRSSESLISFSTLLIFSFLTLFLIYHSHIFEDKSKKKKNLQFCYPDFSFQFSSEYSEFVGIKRNIFKMNTDCSVVFMYGVRFQGLSPSFQIGFILLNIPVINSGCFCSRTTFISYSLPRTQTGSCHIQHLQNLTFLMCPPPMMALPKYIYIVIPNYTMNLNLSDISYATLYTNKLKTHMSFGNWVC